MGENIFQGGKKGVIDLKLFLTPAGEISLGFKEWEKNPPWFGVLPSGFTGIGQCYT